MDKPKFIESANIYSQCKKYGLPLWQCPQFLFLIMGAVIVTAILTTYIVGTHYVNNPPLITLIILILVVILFVISFVIIKSFERLAEANRMKSEFVNIVSHQLRSPLTNLNWTIELLMSGEVGKIGEKQVDYFRILKENSGRMADLISDLLIASKIETATLPAKKEEVSLRKILDELIKEFALFAKASNVEMKFDFQENLPLILADSFQIKLAIENLLDNAIRYVKTNGEVSIKLEKQGKNIYLEIKDNGVGIPKDDQKYIFQRFFRSENALRHQTQGTGLGLYITKAIIEKSGGKISFKSIENKGTTFSLIFPAK
ncbi:MAG: HAMP domain-containing sensor histidine kinase [Candidatus Pacebacteria bacterium]|nr:HAMP domain-containing sensor histidine kinase [Candidatus Paceibacterota bacterium]